MAYFAISSKYGQMINIKNIALFTFGLKKYCLKKFYFRNAHKIISGGRFPVIKGGNPK